MFVRSDVAPAYNKNVEHQICSFCCKCLRILSITDIHINIHTETHTYTHTHLDANTHRDQRGRVAAKNMISGFKGSENE